MAIEKENLIIEAAIIPEVFFEFIEAFGIIPKNAIIQAYQRDMPCNIEDLALQNRLEENLDYSFALINLLESKERGGQIIATSQDEDSQIAIKMHMGVIEIEIFSLVQFEVIRSIQLLSTMFTHLRGIDFFAKHSISPLYVEKVKNTSKLENNSKYFSSSLAFHFSYYTKVKEPMESFSAVHLNLQEIHTKYL